MAGGFWRGALGWCCVVVLAGGGLTVLGAEPRETERQTREFAVSVDGTERGSISMQIRRSDDKTERVKISTDLLFKLVILQYRYSSSGAEVWKADRLVGLDNRADFNGTKYAVKAAAGRKNLQVTVNGKTSEARPEVWPTSYWRLPERLEQATQKQPVELAGAGDPEPMLVKPVPLLDSDKGGMLRGELTFVGEETLVAAGRKVACRHYRLRGDVKVDLWYDPSRRLVRKESVEQGHETILTLTRIAAE